MSKSDSLNTHRLTRRYQALIGIIVVGCLAGPSIASLAQSGPLPVIDAQASFYDPARGSLILRGSNFESGAAVSLAVAGNSIPQGRTKVKGANKILVAGVAESDVAGGVDVNVVNPDGGSSGVVHLSMSTPDPNALNDTDVKTIIAQAVAQAIHEGLKATVAVVDREGNVLGVFRMTGAVQATKIGTGKTCSDPSDCGLEGVSVGSDLAAISKAGTGAFLSSQGHAFTTRTASFIVQEHFPPGVDFTPGGPLFGVQFSQLLCSDINPTLPLGLSADPGGVPLYKNGQLAGGIGVEGDGKYGLAQNPGSNDQPVEELVAVAATRGFEAPVDIQGDKIIVNGIRFPFVNTAMPPSIPVPAFNQLGGTVLSSVISAPASKFSITSVDGIQVRVSATFFPSRAGSALTKAEVDQVLIQALKQAIITRAAIRMPLGSAAQVNVSVVDVDGSVLGIMSNADAPVFGFDVSAQKARTCTFYSSSSAGASLRSAEGGKFIKYADAAGSDGLKLDGSVAFTDRAGGFLSRPFFPDGLDGTANGPFSKPIDRFSPFNDGLQLDLLLTSIGNALNGSITPCTAIAALKNGIQIFPGSVPLYKNGRLVGGIGVSGDGVDQDDLIATMGSAGFEAPAGIRADQVFVRGVRLPYVKFPRHPDLP
jgi:uncharacterized protein GlcG (DUF336 family)